MPNLTRSEQSMACLRRKKECTPLAPPTVINRNLVDSLVAWGFLAECDDWNEERIKEAYANFIQYLSGGAEL